MRMPDELRMGLDRVIGATEHSALKRASGEISAAYKTGNFAQPPLRSSIHRLAYALVRMPATYAANVHALRQVKVTIPGIAPVTLLDLGAGTGASAWAVSELFPSIEKYTLLERDRGLIELGQTIAGGSSMSLRNGEWSSTDIENVSEFPPADMVMISYSIGELASERRTKLVERAWAAAKQVLVVIEPGTRKGFDTIFRVREQLIRMKIQIAAPCPHMEQCPMAAAGDWCHFAQRIDRSSEHRRIKEGSLGYEDEKFSYVAASRMPTAVPDARVVRHPKIFSGYVRLELCNGPVLQERTVTRSQGQSYKEARHARWGDSWNH
jgi:ribosomal protein RSM22 (predicted rRNA methylase)